MDGGPVNIGEQSIVRGGWTVMQELLTMDFNNNEDQASNHEEVEYEDCGIGDSSYSSVKLSAKHLKET
jgi:hypothetical protein